MARAWQKRFGLAALSAALVLVPLAMVAAADDADAPAPPAGAAPAAPKPQGPNVRIVFTVVPNTKKATVTWGKKKLGLIGPHAPLIVQRPRDSGPLDVVVRADGCVPVQTRAYTFEDSKVAVNTLLGFREEVSPDGGVAVPSSNPDGGAR